MAELGRIEPVKKLACGHCQFILSDEDLEQLFSEEADYIYCPHCNNPIKLPDYLVRKLIEKKYLGKIFDITA
jgi:hypothetical protein